MTAVELTTKTPVLVRELHEQRKVDYGKQGGHLEQQGNN